MNTHRSLGCADGECTDSIGRPFHVDSARVVDEISMDSRQPSAQPNQPPAPFTALLASSSIVLAVLLVAGFSYRWAYFYNFGLQDLALNSPAQSITISALELVRRPEDAAASIGVVAVPLVLLGALVKLLRRFARGHSAGPLRLLRKSLAAIVDAPIVLDLARVGVLVYAAYMAGSMAGVKKFESHVVESAANSLPRVTLALGSKTSDVYDAVACKAVDWNAVQSSAPAPRVLLGALGSVKALHLGLTCNVAGQRSWRLLYRDDRFIYVFATGAAIARPVTLVVPQGDISLLVVNGE